MITLRLMMTWPVQREVSVTLRRNCLDIRDNAHAIEEDGVVTIGGMFSKTNRVPDVDRYRIGRRGTVWYVKPHQVCEVGQTRNNRFKDILPANDFRGKTLVIILESPHRDEYLDCDIGQPIAPAQGTTGNNIRDKLADVLNGHDDLSTHLVSGTRVILCNPVQFQASLASVVSDGQAPLARPVWRQIWRVNEVKENFLVRLSSYRPDYMVNACTRELQGLVTNFLLEHRHDLGAELYKGYHPSVWAHARRRHLELVQTNA